MFGIFKRLTELEKLQNQYEKLMADWHRLSTTNRAQSDQKYAEAEKVLAKIEALKN